MSQAEKKRQQIEMGSYIMGLINILVFGRMLGDKGIAFCILGLESFFFVSILAMGSLTDTLGKLLRSRNQKGQYVNAAQIRKHVLMIQGSLGVVSSVIFACCGSLIANKVFGVRYCSAIIMLMAPILCFRNISAILLGFSQGEGTELPRAVAAPLRQIMVLGFGCVFVRMMQAYGEKVANLLGDSSYVAMYGGMGLVIGMLLAEILIFIFVGLITLGNRKKLSAREERGMKQKESFVGTMRILYGSMGVGTLAQIVTFFPLWAGAIFYGKSVGNVTAFVENYGLFTGKYLTVCTIPVVWISMLLVKANFRTLDASRKEEVREAKGFFRGGMQIGIVHAIFWSVFVAVLAEQLVEMLSPNGGEIAVEMFRFGSFAILSGTLLWYFVKLLMGMKKKYYILGSLIVADIVFVVLYFVLAMKENMGVMALVYATLAAMCVGCGITGFWCCRMIGWGIDWLRFIAIPAGAGCLVGIVSLLMGKLLTSNLGNIITLLLCLVVSVILYWVILIVFRCFEVQQTKYIPGGGLIARLNRLFGIS